MRYRHEDSSTRKSYNSPRPLGRFLHFVYSNEQIKNVIKIHESL